MPQLDFSSYIGQISWLLLSFSVLYVVVRFLFVPRVECFIQDREDVIRKNLEAAQQMLDEAGSIRAEVERNLKKTTDEAHDITHDAEANIKIMLAKKSVDDEITSLKALKKEHDELAAWYEDQIENSLPELVAAIKRDVIHSLMSQFPGKKI